MLVAVAFSVVLYALGTYIMFRAGLVWMILYILYFLWLEIRLLRNSCTKCCYYGKVCAFGRGKICAVFFKQGEPQEFAKIEITWKSMVPDLLVTVIPVIAAIVLMVMDFSWLILASVLIMIVLTSAGNGFIRSSLACKYCRQREIGCPAVQLFEKKNVV